MLRQPVLFPLLQLFVFVSGCVFGAKATGIAYLQGSEGLSDFASLLSRYMGEADPLGASGSFRTKEAPVSSSEPCYY